MSFFSLMAKSSLFFFQSRLPQPPHMSVYESVVGYIALYWRDGVRVVVELDDSLTPRRARVEYGQD